MAGGQTSTWVGKAQALAMNEYGGHYTELLWMGTLLRLTDGTWSRAGRWNLYPGASLSFFGQLLLCW